MALSDITAFKRAEDTQRRMQDLGATNQELQREIIRRRAVERALKKSEEHQSQLLEESRRMQEQLRNLSHQVLQAQEEERKRISRDLHDQVAQALVGINVYLADLDRQEGVNPKTLKRTIARTRRLVEASVNIVHRFARELRPTLLDDLGLVPALHSLVKDFAKRTGIRTSLTTSTSPRVLSLDSTRSMVLYRVAQEALSNVARHSQASHASVTLQKLSASLQLEVADDGKGLDARCVLFRKRQSRLGVIGMRERLQMVGGQFTFESEPGKGTTIRAQIPLRKAGS
jgi:signal transduction histidine kinase